MFNFLHNFLPQPILFQFGFIKIYWYGVFIVLGIIAGLVVVLKLAKRQGLASDEIYNLGFYLIIFGLIGGRIYSVLLDLPYYLQNPFEIIAVWHGGLAIHGVLLGGIITLLVYTHPLTLALSPKGRGEGRGVSFWQWADILAPAIALGQAIGRWGNYFNQELFGKPTNLPWGIPIALENRPLEYLSHQYFQPTFLYESVLDLVNFVLLIFLFFRIKKRNYESRIMNHGLVALVYLINYSLIRIGMEFLRVDAAPEVFGIRLPILVSLGVILASLGFLLKKLGFNK